MKVLLFILISCNFLLANKYNVDYTLVLKYYKKACELNNSSGCIGVGGHI